MSNQVLCPKWLIWGPSHCCILLRWKLQGLQAESGLLAVFFYTVFAWRNLTLSFFNQCLLVGRPCLGCTWWKLFLELRHGLEVLNRLNSIEHLCSMINGQSSELFLPTSDSRADFLVDLLNRRRSMPRHRLVDCGISMTDCWITEWGSWCS